MARLKETAAFAMCLLSVSALAAAECSPGPDPSNIQGITPACLAAYHTLVNNTALQQGIAQMSLASGMNKTNVCGLGGVCDVAHCASTGNHVCRCEWENTAAFVSQCTILGGEVCISSTDYEWPGSGLRQLIGESYFCRPPECTADQIKLMMTLTDEACVAKLKTIPGITSPTCASDAFCPASGTSTSLGCKATGDYNGVPDQGLSPSCQAATDKLPASQSFQSASLMLQSSVGKKDVCSTGGLCQAATTCVNLNTTEPQTCTCEWTNTNQFQIACEILGGEICYVNTVLRQEGKPEITITGDRYVCRPLACTTGDTYVFADVYDTECVSYFDSFNVVLDCESTITCPKSGIRISAATSGTATCTAGVVDPKTPIPGLSAQCQTDTTAWDGSLALREASKRLQTPPGQLVDCSLGAVCDGGTCIRNGEADCPCTWSGTTSYDAVCETLGGEICIASTTISAPGQKTIEMRGSEYSCQPNSCSPPDLSLKVAALNAACEEASRTLSGYEQATCTGTLHCPASGVTVSATSTAAGLGCQADSIDLSSLSSACANDVTAWLGNIALQESIEALGCSQGTLDNCWIGGICDTFSCQAERKLACQCEWWNQGQFRGQCQTLGGTVCTQTQEWTISDGTTGTMSGNELLCIPSSCTAEDHNRLIDLANQVCANYITSVAGVTAQCTAKLSCENSPSGSSSTTGSGTTGGSGKPKGTSSAGAIVGGVIGGLCLVAVLGAIFYWFHHQKDPSSSNYYSVDHREGLLPSEHASDEPTRDPYIEMGPTSQVQA
eukprot:m.39104 g.39104  ORF g.39104 m.39104 type:complete len:783 (-) comp11236_c0_seq2:283-2631(-)